MVESRNGKSDRPQLEKNRWSATTLAPPTRRAIFVQRCVRCGVVVLWRAATATPRLVRSWQGDKAAEPSRAEHNEILREMAGPRGGGGGRRSWRGTRRARAVLPCLFFISFPRAFTRWRYLHLIESIRAHERASERASGGGRLRDRGHGGGDVRVRGKSDWGEPEALVATNVRKLALSPVGRGSNRSVWW